MLGTDEIGATTLGERSDALGHQRSHHALGFPARPLQPVRLARLVSAAVAGSVDASIDDIEDLRIAVGEACAILVGHATTDGRVEITIAVGSDSMTFDSRLTGGRCDDPQVETSWRNWFLGSLADNVDFRLLDTGASLTFRWPLAAAVDADANVG